MMRIEEDPNPWHFDPEKQCVNDVPDGWIEGIGEFEEFFPKSGYFNSESLHCLWNNVSGFEANIWSKLDVFRFCDLVNQLKIKLHLPKNLLILQLNKFLLDSTKNLSLFSKIIWLDEVHFFLDEQFKTYLWYDN